MPWARGGIYFYFIERVEIARIARVSAARPGGGELRSVVVNEPSAMAALMVAGAASRITAGVVDDLEAGGLTRERYVEIIGVVIRTVAIDTLALDRGVGRPPRALPTTVVGMPIEARVLESRQRAGWVPTVGAISPPSALT